MTPCHDVCLPAFLSVHCNNSPRKLLAQQQPTSVFPLNPTVGPVSQQLVNRSDPPNFPHSPVARSSLSPPPCRVRVFLVNTFDSENTGMMTYLRTFLQKHQSKAGAVAGCKDFKWSRLNIWWVHCHQQLIRKFGHFCVTQNVNRIAQAETETLSNV